MIEFLKYRFEELSDKRNELTEKLSNFYGGDEYAAAEASERPGLEERRGISAAKNQLWETATRRGVIAGALTLRESDAATLEEYFEARDGDAMASLEKGLPENPSRRQIVLFLSQGFICDECIHMIAAIKTNTAAT